MPAFNEERTIVSSVQSLLRLGYPEFEVLVVNDGSTDNTFEEVRKAFSLVEFPEAYRKRLATARREVRAVAEYEYVIVNDELEACVDRLRAIVLAERARLNAVQAEAERIVETFGERVQRES